MRNGSTLLRLAGLTARQPGLIPALLRAAWRFRARQWYRRPPFLPLPPASYLSWRLITAFGDEGAVPPAAALRRYLRWAAWMRRSR